MNATPDAQTTLKRYKAVVIERNWSFGYDRSPERFWIVVAYKTTGGVQVKLELEARDCVDGILPEAGDRGVVFYCTTNRGNGSWRFQKDR